MGRRREWDSVLLRLRMLSLNPLLESCNKTSAQVWAEAARPYLPHATMAAGGRHSQRNMQNRSWKPHALEASQGKSIPYSTLSFFLTMTKEILIIVLVLLIKYCYYWFFFCHVWSSCLDHILKYPIHLLTSFQRTSQKMRKNGIFNTANVL